VPSRGKISQYMQMRANGSNVYVSMQFPLLNSLTLRAELETASRVLTDERRVCLIARGVLSEYQSSVGALLTYFVEVLVRQPAVCCRL
jgi:hypothetical protein